MSPRNAGFRTFRGELQTDEDGQPVKGNWDAIVDEETWRGVRDKLANPARRSGASRARRHLLSNLVTCGVKGCGGRLGSGVNSHGRLIYVCRSCNRNSRNGAWLDAVVVEHVVDRLSRPDAVELTQPAPRADVDEIRGRGRALRARLDSLAVEFADGVLSTAQIKTMTTRINEQLAEIDAVLRDAQSTRVYDGVIGAEDVDAAFDGLDLDRKRAIIDSLLTIVVRPSGRCGRTFKREDVDVRFRQP
jgi:hypothetical protein